MWFYQRRDLWLLSKVISDSYWSLFWVDNPFSFPLMSFRQHYTRFLFLRFLFTARCYAERDIATASRLSVPLSLTLRYCDHIGWKTSKIISRNRGGYGKNGFPANRSSVSYVWNGTMIRLLLRTSSPIRAFDFCQNQRPLITLKRHYALCFMVLLLI